MTVTKGWMGLPLWAILFPALGVPVVLLSVYAMGTIGTIVAAVVLLRGAATRGVSTSEALRVGG